MISKDSQLYSGIEKYHKLVTQGRVLSIDPSIGSTSSMPGWAVYQAGELQESGTLRIEVVESIPIRLQELARQMRELIRQYQPDILVYEEIPAQRHGGGNAVAHASLLKAVGVILSIPGPTSWLGIYPKSWKRLARASYKKGDEEDACEIGYCVYEVARWYEREEAGKKAKRKRSSTNSLRSHEEG